MVVYLMPLFSFASLKKLAWLTVLRVQFPASPPLFRKVLACCLLPDQAAVSLFSELDLSVLSGSSGDCLLAASVSLPPEFKTAFNLRCLTSLHVLLLTYFLIVQHS